MISSGHSQRVAIILKFSQYTICHWAMIDIICTIDRIPLWTGLWSNLAQSDRSKVSLIFGNRFNSEQSVMCLYHEIIEVKSSPQEKNCIFLCFVTKKQVFKMFVLFCFETATARGHLQRLGEAREKKTKSWRAGATNGIDQKTDRRKRPERTAGPLMNIVDYCTYFGL